MQYSYIISSGPHTLFRLFLAACLVLALSHQAAVSSALAANGIAEGETVLIEAVHIEGLIHTKRETIIRLLPRSLPDEFTRAEVRNLSGECGTLASSIACRSRAPARM